MWNFWILLALLCFVKGQLLIDLLYGSLTNSTLVSSIEESLLENFAEQVTIRNKQLDSYVINFEQKSDIIVNLIGSAFIRNNSLENDQIILSAKKWNNLKNSFAWHFSIIDHIKAFESLISYLNWEKFVIISDENEIEYIDEVLKKFYNAHVFYFPKNGNQLLSDLLVGKQIKPTGIKNIVILNDGEDATKLIHSLKAKNIYSGILLLNQNLRNQLNTGLLAYTESGLEDANNEIDQECLAITKFIKLVLSYKNIYSFLEEYSAHANFTLINIQNGEKNYVGSIIDGEIALKSEIIWPGSTTSMPNNPSTEVKVSISDGLTNPGYQNSPPVAKAVKNGALYALKYIKDIHFIDGFDISLTHTDCGAQVYSPNFNLKCFKALKDQLGVGFLASFFGVIITGNINTFRALNITIPHISDIGNSGALTSKEKFPEFMRVSKDSRYIATVIVNFCITFGWKKVIALYENNTGPTIVYNQFATKAAESHIDIVNNITERAVKPNYLHTDYHQYKQWMENFIDSKVRIYIIFLAPPNQFYFFEDLYDTGLRRGDTILIFYDRVAYSFFMETNLTQREKLKELLYGSIMIAQADWVGNYGKEIEQGYIKEFSYPLDYRCFSFDAAMLLLHGIKYTIAQGGNVENSTLLNINLRNQKFTGCSGTISIESDTNDRSTGIIGVYSMMWNQTSSSFYEHWVGRYDFEKVQLFTLWDSVIFYDNTTNIPDDTIAKPTCPFEESSIIFSKIGAGFLYIISFGILFFSIVVTYYIWKKYWNIEIPNLAEKKLIYFQDYITMGIIIIDFLQLIGMGPDMRGYDEISSLLADYATINYSWLTRGETFWIFVYASLAAVLVWIYFSVYSIFEFNRFDHFLCNFTRNFAELALPFIGNACFLPIISILLSVFQCDQGIGEDLSQSFVRNDCSVFCWKGIYIFWAFLSIFALLTYIPLAIYFRLNWENQNSGSNIKSRPWYMMLKSLCQIAIIIMNKTIKPQNAALHGFIYSILLLAFALICIRKKPYNYSRCNLWLAISHFGVLWSLILSSIFWISYYRFVPLWVSIEYFGWVMLLICGLYLQWKYCPSLLFSEKSLDISLFFRFSLGNSASEKTLIMDIIKKKNELKKEIKNYKEKQVA